VSRTELLEHFSSFLTAPRRQRFAAVLARRTRRLVVVLDEVHDRHNISAVLRSCDAFGLQDVYVIDSEDQFTANAEIALGSEKWLTVRRFTGPRAAADCLASLRRSGYALAATAAAAGGCAPFDRLPVDRPWAIVFGNERVGVSADVLAEAEQRVCIPMEGFVESLNISAAAAIVLQGVSSRLRQSMSGWELSDSEQAALLYDWTRQSVPSVEFVEQRFLEERRRAAV
jgi:tRNA (guanosine-2'-O-)-methyltransferase